MPTLGPHIAQQAKARPIWLPKSVCMRPLLFLVLLAPTLLRAQFQQPTDDELKMTADPKAPGAAAVYLNVSEISDLDLKYHRFYARIKVLTDKGKELATVELPYRKHMYNVADIKGRTIQPDGTVVPLTGKPSDLLKAKGKGYQSGRKVFTLPSVEVGSILEYYFELRYTSEYIPIPYWEIQHTYLVRKAHYQCLSCNNLSYLSVLPAGAATSKDHLGHLTLDLTDVPPSPSEEWMPPMETMLYKVVFYTSSARSSDDFWKNMGNEWSESAKIFTEPSKAFRESMNGLIAPGDSDIDKAKKLYKAVQTVDNTDFSREKSESERKQLKIKDIERAEDVWTEKSGTRTEVALLYLSMLRAVGLTAYAIRVVDRNQRLFMPADLDYDQLDDTIVILSTGGKEIVLDPGEKMCPFQTVHWKHSNAGGIRQNATGSAIATSPQQSYTANTIDRIAEFALDDQGSVDGNIRFVMNGQEALYWRQNALENDEAEVKKQFDEWIKTMVPDGVEAHVDHFTALDDPDSKLVALVQAKGDAGTATSKRVLVPGFFFEARGSHPFVDQDKRQAPVDMHFGEQVTDQVIYRLPADLQVESAPQSSKIPWEGRAVLLVKSKSDPGQVTITRTFARAFTFATTDEYKNLHDFYQKVAAADQQQLVLTRTTTATASGAN